VSRYWLVGLGVASACGGQLHTHEPGVDYLAAIRLEGNRAIATGALEPALALHEVIREGGPLDPYLLTADTERIRAADGSAERLRITLAVAGFADCDLEVLTEENQLIVRGRQNDDTEREYLHRGIAARQFQRTFVLADGMRVAGAELKNGLLAVDLDRPEPERLVRKINISVKD